MEMANVLYSRKSVRTYTGNKISEDALNNILKAAKSAPVGMGRYNTVHITIVENPHILDEINEKTKELFKNPEMIALYGAPTLAVVSVKPDNSNPNNTEYSNAAIMVQNMALAATEIGIGCCHIWGAVMAIAADHELAKKLELPDGFVPCCGIVIGETTEKYSICSIPEDKVSTNYVR